MSRPQMPKWVDNEGKVVACTEKIKVMNENMDELFQMAQDAFEDALLMGCNETQLRTYFSQLIDSVENPYQK